jgi:hypothetical protein
MTRYTERAPFTIDANEHTVGMGDFTFILGVNEDGFDPLRYELISSASLFKAFARCSGKASNIV